MTFIERFIKVIENAPHSSINAATDTAIHCADVVHMGHDGSVVGWPL